MVLQTVIGRFAWLKLVLQLFDPAARKAFSATCMPGARGDLGDNANKMDQPYATSRALVRGNDGLPEDNSPFTWASSRHYDTSTAMETAVLDLSLDRANAIQSIAIIALIIGALVSIIATITLIWTMDIRNRLANTHLANALAQSNQAKAEAARANERTAELLLQAQQAQLVQEKARLEHEQTRSVVAWRRISPDQHAKLVKALRGYSIKVNVLSPANDPEAAQFAADIVKTLTDGGVTANAATAMFPIPIRGLGMTMTSSDAGTALYMALKGAGFEVKDLPKKDPVMIVVGSKPTAF